MQFMCLPIFKFTKKYLGAQTAELRNTCFLLQWFLSVLHKRHTLGWSCNCFIKVSGRIATKKSYHISRVKQLARNFIVGLNSSFSTLLCNVRIRYINSFSIDKNSKFWSLPTTAWKYLLGNYTSFKTCPRPKWDQWNTLIITKFGYLADLFLIFWPHNKISRLTSVVRLIFSMLLSNN